MRDFIILLLLLGLLWGSYKGLIYLNDYTHSETSQTDTATDILADNTKKRLNKSAIKEIKNKNLNIEKKKDPVVKKPDPIVPNQARKDGQKAVEKSAGETRLDSEGKQRSKEDFYKESVQKETLPYERNNNTTEKNRPTANSETDVADKKAAMAEKGKALASEFTEKGGNIRKSSEKTTFNIETGKNESASSPTRPKAYNQPEKKFIPSKYVLVAGSFASADNAAKEVSRLRKQGYNNAGIVLSEKSLNLISLGSFSNRSAAKAQAIKIKERGVDVYVKGIQ